MDCIHIQEISAHGKNQHCTEGYPYMWGLEDTLVPALVRAYADVLVQFNLFGCTIDIEPLLQWIDSLFAGDVLGAREDADEPGQATQVTTKALS